jgi:hypothetical protein
VPDDWQAREADNKKGVEFVDPNNKHNRIRVMEGDPNARWDSQKDPYAQDQRNGQTRDVKGDPVENLSAGSHIPAQDFRYRP